MASPNDEWMAPILSDPGVEPLAQALAAIAEKEFGHVLNPSGGDSWLTVGCAFVRALKPVYDSDNNNWVISGDYIVDTWLPPKENEE